MRFLHVNECAEWCRDHGAATGAKFALESDPTLLRSGRVVFAPSGSVGLEGKAAGACLAAVVPTDEILLWIVEWGIWPSSEDWPRFYAARGSRGERHALLDKPGHLFGGTETSDLTEFLQLVLEQGWGGHLLAACHGAIDRRVWISHDGWIELHARQPMPFSLSAT